MNVNMQEARNLLLWDDLTVTEAAGLCGCIPESDRNEPGRVEKE